MTTISTRRTWGGNPYSDSYRPDPKEIIAWAERLETAIGTGAGGFLLFADKDALNADLAHPEGAAALVWNDATAENNATYRKVGASGVGSWTTVDVYRPQIIPLTIDTGESTANAIVATAGVAVPSTALSAIYLVQFVAANTGAMSLKIGTLPARSIVSNLTGLAPVAGAVSAGQTATIVDDGSYFRMIIDGDAAPERAAAEAAATASAASATTAEEWAALSNLNRSLTFDAFEDPAGLAAMVSPTTITDWDSATTDGFYQGDDIANAPDKQSGLGESETYFFGYVSVTATSTIVQTVRDKTGASWATYKRFKTSGGSWSTWQNLSQPFVRLPAALPDATTLPVGSLAFLDGTGTDPEIDDSYIKDEEKFPKIGRQSFAGLYMVRPSMPASILPSPSYATETGNFWWRIPIWASPWHEIYQDLFGGHKHGHGGGRCTGWGYMNQYLAWDARSDGTLNTPNDPYKYPGDFYVGDIVPGLGTLEYQPIAWTTSNGERVFAGAEDSSATGIGQQAGLSIKGYHTNIFGRFSGWGAKCRYLIARGNRSGEQMRGFRVYLDGHEIGQFGDLVKVYARGQRTIQSGIGDNVLLDGYEVMRGGIAKNGVALSHDALKSGNLERFAIVGRGNDVDFDKIAVTIQGSDCLVWEERWKLPAGSLATLGVSDGDRLPCRLDLAGLIRPPEYFDSVTAENPFVGAFEVDGSDVYLVFTGVDQTYGETYDITNAPAWYASGGSDSNPQQRTTPEEWVEGNDAITRYDGDVIVGNNTVVYIGATNAPPYYYCKLAHTMALDNKPETGANWATYWDRTDTAGTAVLTVTLPAADVLAFGDNNTVATSRSGAVGRSLTAGVDELAIGGFTKTRFTDDVFAEEGFTADSFAMAGKLTKGVQHLANFNQLASSATLLQCINAINAINLQAERHGLWTGALARYVKLEFTNAALGIVDLRVSQKTGRDGVYDATTNPAGTLFPPDMTAAAAPSPYAVSADSEFSASFPAWKAFDGDPATRWASANDGNVHWLVIDFGSGAMRPDYVKWTAYDSQGPTECTVSISSTGAFAGEEVVLQSRTGLSNSGDVVITW